MSLVHRIRELCQQRKITVAELERQTGISNGQIRKWDTVTPGIDKLEKVADYFNVSVDYLLGRTDNPSSVTSNESETELRKALENVMSFDGEELTENDKDAIIAYMMGRKGK